MKIYHSTIEEFKMKITAFSLDEMVLAIAEDGSFAIGTEITVRKCLERLRDGSLGRLPCTRRPDSRDTQWVWQYIVDDGEELTFDLEEFEQWL